MKLRLVRLDAQSGGAAYDVGFDVTLDSGRRIHSVTTVYASDLADTDRATIIAAARDELLPGLRLQNAPPPTAESAGLGEEIEIPSEWTHTHEGERWPH